MQARTARESCGLPKMQQAARYVCIFLEDIETHWVCRSVRLAAGYLTYRFMIS